MFFQKKRWNFALSLGDKRPYWFFKAPVMAQVEWDLKTGREIIKSFSKIGEAMLKVKDFVLIFVKGPWLRLTSFVLNFRQTFAKGWFSKTFWAFPALKAGPSATRTSFFSSKRILRQADKTSGWVVVG